MANKVNFIGENGNKWYSILQMNSRRNYEGKDASELKMSTRSEI